MARRTRQPRRRALLVIGVLLAGLAVAIALLDAFEQTGPLMKWFGWSAVRGLGTRTLDALTGSPAPMALLAVAGTLLLAAIVSRR